jgi:hypothetical protein
MFLLAVALLSLTVFIVRITNIVEQCYDKVKDEMGFVPKNSTFFKNDEDFCYNYLGRGVSIINARGDLF